MRKKLTKLAKILTNVFAFVFGIVFVAGVIMKENVPQTTGILGGELSKQVDDPEAAEKLENDPLAFEYYRSEFSSVKDVKQYGKDMIEKVVEIGRAHV